MPELTVQLVIEGTIVAEDVAVELTTESHDPGGTRWHARIQLPPSMHLLVGSACALRFSDGRSGDAEITRLGYGRASEPIRIFLRGRSPLR